MYDTSISFDSLSDRTRVDWSAVADRRPPCCYCLGKKPFYVYDCIIEVVEYVRVYWGYQSELVVDDKRQYCYSNLSVSQLRLLIREFSIYKQRIDPEWTISIDVAVVDSSLPPYKCPKCMRGLEEI